MSNALLAAIGTVITMIAFGAFSIVQLDRTADRAGSADATGSVGPDEPT